MLDCRDTMSEAAKVACADRAEVERFGEHCEGVVEGLKYDLLPRLS